MAQSLKGRLRLAFPDTGPRMAFVAVYCSFGAIMFGMDYGFWSGLLGMQQFVKDFGIYDANTKSYILPSSWVSAGSGIPIAGLAIGALLAGLISKRIGRVRACRYLAYMSIVGSLIMTTAITSYWQIMVGRFINTAALGLLANTLPVYLAEVAPLRLRGSLINVYQFSIGIGAVLVGTINWGMNTRTDQWAYRLVLLIQVPLALVFAIGSFFIVESPRWLIGKSRETEAQKNLAILRPYVSRDVITHEVQLLVAAEEENKTHFSSGWLECFRGSNLRRTLIATGVQCFQQAQGNSFVGSYIVLFVQSMGVEDVYKVVVLYLFTFCMSAAFAFYIPDRFGRRWIMTGSTVVLATCMFAVGGLAGSSKAHTQAYRQGALACLFVWDIVMTVAWSSCVWIVTAEVSTLQLREKTITIATISGFSTSILITFISPYIQDPGQGDLGPRIAFLWGAFSISAFVWALFYLPETGFRSLEELDELFHEKVSVWQFRKYKAASYGAQESQLEMHSQTKDLHLVTVKETGNA